MHDKKPAPLARPEEPMTAARPWLAQYPAGVPQDIGPSPFPSLVQMIDATLKEFGSRQAYQCMGKTITFGEVDQAATKLAAFLQSKGLAKGARVAVMMPNVLQYPIAIVGALRGGYAVVNVNPLYTPRELEHQLKDSGAEAIIILENFAHTLQQVVDKSKVKHVIVASMGDLMGGAKGFVVNLVVRKVKKMVPAWSLPGHTPFNAAISAGGRTTFKPVAVSGDDVAFLQYTGGTTGVSKGATLLHRNLLANVQQNEHWIQPALRKGNLPPQMNYVCALPLYHIFALNFCFFIGMRLGAKNILIPNPRDMTAFIKELQGQKIHVFPAVNTLFNGLLNHPDFDKMDLSDLKMAIGGGMAVQKVVADKWKAKTGIPIVEGYGLSETSPTATCNTPEIESWTGTIGLPVPGTDIAIRDDDGNDVPIGTAGEICIRGPQVMAGYWNRPDETAKVMTTDGFFKSGDIGVMDDKGYTKIVDRKKDMVLVSGFNVYPNEVEDVVAQHPKVLEVACIGVPDKNSGEAVKIFVVKKDPSLTEAELMEFCGQQLTGYKKPKHIVFRTDLPKTPVGKILRRELRDAPATAPATAA
jgi:long-chain acyl-CoA synthetase